MHDDLYQLGNCQYGRVKSSTIHSVWSIVAGPEVNLLVTESQVEHITVGYR